MAIDLEIDWIPGGMTIPEKIDMNTREELIRAVDAADSDEIRLLSQRASEEDMGIWEYIMSVVLLDVEENGGISRFLLP